MLMKVRELRADDLPPRLYFENPSLKQSMLKLKAVMISPLEQEQTYAEHVGLIILCELRDALLGKREAPVFRGGLTAQQLNHVRDYTTANLGKDISLSELAGLANLTKFHFVRAFKKTTGMAPYQFVIFSRVERAKELLTDPNSSIAAVARSVGFHSTLQLDRAFHRLVGMTPSSYRDQVANNQSKLRRQEPANASNLRAHPESLDSLRDICRETWQQNADHGETGECSGGAGVTFEVASHAAIAADPSEGRFDNPSLRQDFEASSGRSLPAPSGHGQLAKDYHAGKDRLFKWAVVLHPVWPVRALLRLDQAEERHRLRRPGADARDQLHSRDRFRGVLGLQRVLPTVPDLGPTGGLRLNAVVGASFKT